MIFVNEAFAADGASSSLSGSLMNLLPMVGIFVIFYFFLIRPQVKKQKELKQMIDSLKKGDKVVTAGGLVGTIMKIEDDMVSLQTAGETKLQVLRSSINDCLNKK